MKKILFCLTCKLALKEDIHMLLSPSPWLHCFFFFFNALTSWYAHPTGRLIPQSSGPSATETTANSSIYLKIRDEKDYFSGCQVFGSPESRPSGRGYEGTLLVFGQVVETCERLWLITWESRLFWQTMSNTSINLTVCSRERPFAPSMQSDSPQGGRQCW